MNDIIVQRYNEHIETITAQAATIARLTALVESLDALIEEEMGEWYEVAYAYCPVSVSNLAHMRDAIESNDKELEPDDD